MKSQNSNSENLEDSSKSGYFSQVQNDMQRG